jgi:hypothetical protein
VGLDATIKRPDGKPLGEVAQVQQALASVFPGLVCGMLPSGQDKIRAAAEKGIEFPEVLRKNFESLPERHAADYEGRDFSAEFILGASEIVEHIDVVLRGKTIASDPTFETLHERFGWVTTYP